INYDKLLLLGDSLMEFCYNQLPYSHESPTDSTPNDKNHINQNEAEYFNQQIHFTFGSALAHVYTRKLDIVQRGFGGYNTSHISLLLESLLNNDEFVKNLKLIIISGGTNDASTQDNAYLSLKDVRSNFVKMIKLIKEKNINLIIIGSPVYFPEIFSKMCYEDVQKGYNLDNDLVLQYHNQARELCEQNDIPFLDLRSIMIDNYNSTLTSDGLHLSGYGQYLLYKEMMRLIKQHFPQLYPDNIIKKLPT
ncbi:SGNH hydrolase, partial [Ascoidea rubescens DSM 1968]